MILFVDDNWLALDGWVDTLEDAGHEVIRIDEVVRALEYVQQNASRIMCVLCDVMMEAPEDWDSSEGQRTGIVLANKVRKIRPDLPIIFLTSHSDTVVVDELKAYPFAAYLNKDDVRPGTFARVVKQRLKEIQIQLAQAANAG